MTGIVTLKAFCEQSLEGYNSEDNTFPPHIQEEFLTEKGFLDKDYLCKKANVHLCLDSFKSAVKQVFGTVKFNTTVEGSTLTKDEFSSLYEFGKFTNMREWIGYSYEKTGKLVARKDLYNYVLGS